MEENKNHWYDGIFYDKIIAPNQDKSYSHVRDIIKGDSSLLDAGCGTGRLCFQMHDKCSNVTGIDLSAKNIQTASDNLTRINANNVEFIHSGINTFLSADKTFDYAVLSYVIHEVPESERVNIVQKLAESAGKLIIIDYLVPRPGGIWSAVNEIVEFAAGSEHYKNFKNFVKNNGIKGLAESAGLIVEHEIANSPSSSHIVVLKRNG